MNFTGPSEPSIDVAQPIGRSNNRNREAGTHGQNQSHQADDNAEVFGWGDNSGNKKNNMRDIDDEETKVPVPVNYNMLGG